MRHFLPYERKRSPGNNHAQAPADPERGPDARVSSLVPEVPVPSDSGARHGTLATACLVPLRLTLLGIRLIALLWLLALGQASFAGNVAEREQGPLPHSPARTKSTSQIQYNSPLSARWGGGSTLRPRLHKRPYASPKVWCSDDPYGDDTSDDPDDEAWNDPNDDDDTAVPATAWLQEMVPYLNAPERALETWTAHPSSPFLKLQRLRC